MLTLPAVNRSLDKIRIPPCNPWSIFALPVAGNPLGMYSIRSMAIHFSPSFTYRYWPFTGHNAAWTK